jgi:hypothetical protein
VPCVENNFYWKKELLEVVPLKMDRFVKKNVMVKNVKIILIRNPV